MSDATASGAPSDSGPGGDSGPGRATSKPRKPDRRRAITRQAIISSASELFSRQGVELTTIEEIAAGAGVSAGTVYFHFASKDGVVLALVARVLDTAEEYLAVARASGSPLERLLRSGDVYFAFATEQRVTFRYVSERLPTASDAPTEGADAVPAEIVARVGAFVASIATDLQEAMDAGEIDQVPLDEAMSFLWGAWNGVAGLILRDDELAISPELGARALALGRRVMIRGLGGTLPDSLASPSA
ncbi:MAG: TetR/AcrR family transcriptional regulator [Solirubrobacteraceae bacterium]|nr:TetR/AcrR family transcriptional regulator [Solirubrobacteraceae bacterium]